MICFRKCYRKEGGVSVGAGEGAERNLPKEDSQLQHISSWLLLP